jgi:uncharacterized protein YjdB
MRKIVAALTSVLAIAGCSGDSGTSPKPPAVSSVVISQQSATLFVGSTLTLTATPKDASGNALLGRTINWTTSNAGAATVSNGLVTAVAPGLATITATVEGKAADAAITVQVVPVATVTVDPPTSNVMVGGTAQLAVTLKDANGATLNGRTVTWTSSNDAKASVSASGLVTGIAGGTVTITATSETKSGTASVAITGPNSPTITAVAPDTLEPSATMTIAGTNFASVAGDNSVTVGGQVATVTAASATQLTVTLPPVFPCQPTQGAPVVVTTDDGSATVQHTLRVAQQRTFAVGESMLITDAAAIGCNELAATGGRYFVSVYNTSSVPSSVASFELRGTAGPASSSTRFPATREPAAMGSPFARGGVTMTDVVGATIRERGARQHLALLEESRKVGQRLLALRRGAARASRLAATPLPTVGSIVPMKMRTTLDDCSNYTTVGGRVVYVGTKTIVLEDTLAPFARQHDPDYESFGQEFDDVMYPILTENFGDPLAYDASTDANGRIIMLFTPKVNEFGGIAGFMSACDLTSSYLASNHAEVFYAAVEDGDFWDHTFWRAEMPGTIIHESKHLASFAERLASPTATTFEASWLEEGTAQVASELYARRGYGTAWKGDATYQQTLYCEARLYATTGPCVGSDYNVIEHFLWLEDYFAAHEVKSFYTLASFDITIYGSAWLFVRWATDQYATSESAFLKALTLDGTRQGLANLSDKTGVPAAEMVGWFSLANIADDYPALALPAGARYSEPSWNLPDVFSAMSADLTSHPPAQPVTRHAVSYGSFAMIIPQVAGGAAAYFEVSGAQIGAQLLDLHARNGAALPSSTPLRIGIVRVE